MKITGNYLFIRNRELYKINVILAVLGLPVMCVWSYYLSAWYVLGVLGCFSLLTKISGVELDLEQRKIRNCRRFFGFSRGHWKEFTAFTVLVLLTKRGSKTMEGVRSGRSYELKGVFYELYLMDAFHRRRIFLDSSENKARLDQMMHLLKERLSLSVEGYHPH